MLIRPKIQRIPMTKEEFLRQAPVRENCLVDWEDGTAIRMSAAHGRHGVFILRLGSSLDDFFSDNNLGRVWQELFVDFGPKTFGVDLAALFSVHVSQYVNGRIEGAPDLVVEVLSDDSQVRDRTTKFDFYYQQSVSWYWIGDPVLGTLEEYHHTAEGYVRTASGTLDSPFRPAALPGFTVDLNRLVEPTL